MGGVCCCQQQNYQSSNHNIEANKNIPSILERLANAAEAELSKSSVQKSFLDIDIGISNNNNVSKININKSFLTNYPVTIINHENYNIFKNDEIKDILKPNSLLINFKASIDETILPIWCSAGRQVIFSVFGKWGCLENEVCFTSSGAKEIEVDSNDLPFNLPFGSLCAYVQGDECVYLIKNGFSFTPNVSGTLVLFQNNGDWDVKPQGSLLLVIDGATKRTLEDIDLTSGWDMCILYDLNDILYLTDDEKKLIYYINKARTNPSLFADVFLSHRQYKSNLEKECYDLMKNTEGIKPLKVCRDICSVAKLHALDMSNNNLNSHLSSDGKSLKERLIGKNVDLDKIGENISFGIFDPLQIVIDLLVDESDSRGHRKNILDKEFDLIGVSISDHVYYGKCCVQDFVKTL